MIKKGFSVFLALCLVLTLLPITASAAEVASGTCGATDSDEVKWSLDDSGTLTISGSGNMKDYAFYVNGDPIGYETDRPWENLQNSVSSVVVNDGITSIGGAAFKDLKGLNSISIPQSVCLIGPKAFEYCSSLTTITLPSQLESIGKEAFASSGLLSIQIPGSVTSIGSRVFASCHSLTNAVFESGITTIGERMFYQCTVLNSVTVPDSVTSIKERAFEDTALEHVTLPQGLEEIGLGAFGGCTKLSMFEGQFKNFSVVNGALFNNNKTQLYAYPAGNTATSYDIPDTVVTIGDGAFLGCENLTAVTIPNSVTTIGEYAFHYCINLTSITIPDKVSAIQDETFSSCISLASVTIPASVREIGNGVFTLCRELKTVYYEGSQSQWNQIEKGTENAALTNAEIICQSPDPVTYTLTYALNGGSGMVPAAKSYEEGDSVTLASAPTQTGYTFDGWSDGANIYSAGAKFVMPAKNVTLTAQWTQESVDPVPTGDPKILTLSPGSGAEFPGTVFDITFDREIAEDPAHKNAASVNLTMNEPFQIHRALDDSVVYTTNQFLWPNFTYGSTKAVLHIQPTNANVFLNAEETYYITMGAGFVSFKDGKKSLAIEKGQWTFTVPKPTSPVTPSTNKSFKAEITFGTCIGGREATDTVVWDDSWFETSAKTYNHQLAVASVALSGSAYAAGGAAGGLSKLRFDGPSRSYDYEVPVWENIFGDGTVGYTISYKDITVGDEPYKLVAVVVRGTQGAEWASNFLDSGMADYTSGFDDAAKKVLDSLKEYMDLRKIDITGKEGNVKFLVTGHSRGGIVANLVAAELSTGNVFDRSAAYGQDNVYCYTVASPRVSIKSGDWATCYNIYNIIHPADIVPKVPPMDKSCERYGKDLFLPIKSNKKGDETSRGGEIVSVRYDDYRVKMDSTFYSLTGESFTAAIESFNPFRGIGAYHSIASYYSWMARYSEDELFGKVNQDTAPPQFKRLEIACPVDVYIYDEADSVVASVVDEKVVVDLLEVSVADGVKTVDMPLDEDYRVRIVARDAGTVHYKVMEMSIESVGEVPTRTVDFSEISIAQGDELTGTVNDVIATPVNNYILTKTTESGVTTTIPAASDTLPVNPSTGGGSGGSSSGGGSSSSGGGYSISVPGNLTGGKVTVSPANANKGKTVTITVTLDENYILNRLTVKDSKGTELALTDKGNGKYTFTMPGSKVTVDAAIVPAGGNSGDSDQQLDFADVPSSAYYYDAVTWAVAQGITNGTTNTAFSPNLPCTRAQIVTFLWRAAGSPEAGGSNPFTDVNAGSYYYDAVRWAAAQGVTAGTTDTTFSPDRPCTRAQAVTFLYRNEQAENRVTDAGRNPFTDVNPDSNYAKAILWAVSNGITSGTTSSTFSPDATCTRAQIVTFLYRNQAN